METRADEDGEDEGSSKGVMWIASTGSSAKLSRCARGRVLLFSTLHTYAMRLVCGRWSGKCRAASGAKRVWCASTVKVLRSAAQ